ncbi:hypothetical protein [Mechercharimyces sp. CAU 1602]|uniref:hypothetical protein n=1 Tax=Mechercharimyces sp. CAU 1602 TaxID=2973933 RepID=UPI0021628624|nr:hypothetical protein [Mechercharimyces sp. CAU 1602]MCS1352678.1 hypothetical protein [Mechercharimyces sp. CAU 1602]
MIKRTRLLFPLLLAILLLAGGCSLGSDGAEESQTDKAKVVEIKFGDYPEDDNNDEVINARTHFGRDETFAMSYKLLESPNTKKYTVRWIKLPENRIIEEMHFTSQDPSDKTKKWEFTNHDKFNGFYTKSDYKMQVLRGEDLLAEGTFTIID